MRLALGLALVGAGGCGGGACEPPDQAGTITGTIDGAAWTGTGVVWTLAGGGLQVTSDQSAWRVTLVGQQTTDGQPLEDAMDADALPVTVDLGGNGGFVILYPESGGSVTSEGGGTLTFTAFEGDELLGCAETLAVDGASSVDATLAFRASPL